MTANDYESVIIPAVETVVSRQGKVRFLFHLGKDFAGFQAGAVWDDTKLGLRHLGSWERVALVSDVEWIRAAARVFGLAIPGDVRVFPNRELAEATRWIGG